MKYTPALSSLSVALMLPLAALAQTAPASRPPEDEPVKLSPFEVNLAQDIGYRASNSVSATRMNIPLKNLPVTINAFTQDFIEDQKPRDLIDIVRFAPGVTNGNPEFVGGQAIFFIRGFDSKANLRNGFAGPAVLDTVNVARVEVIKGPASLLYGNIEPGGVINYITKRPEAKSFVSVMQAVGTDGYYRTELDVNNPGLSASSPVQFRLVGAYDHAAEFYAPSGRIGRSLNPSVTVNLGPKTQLAFDYENFSSRESPTVLTMQAYVVNGILVGPGTDFGLPWDFNAASVQDFRNSDAQTWTIDGHTEIAGWTVRAAYNKFTQKIVQFSTANLSGTNPVTPVILRRGRIQFDRRIDDAWQVETTRTFDLASGKLNVLLGYQQGDRESTGSQRNMLPPLPPTWNLLDRSTWGRNFNIDLGAIPEVNPFRIDDERDGLYGVAHLTTLQDTLHLLAGVRYSTADSVTTTKSGAGVETRSAILHAKETSPQLGALYQVTPAIGLYASYSKSFRPEGGSLTINNVAGAAAKVPLIGEGYDAGLKFNFFDGRFSANLAVFTLDYTGTVTQRVVGTDPITNNVIVTQSQDGKDRSKGVELDWLWTPNPNWQLYGTYAHLNSYAVTNTNPVLIGQRRANTSADTANLFLKYSFTDGPLKGFSLAGGPSYSSPRRADALSPYYYPEVTVVNVLASYGWGPSRRYAVDLSVKNLFDEHYYDSSSSTRGDPRRASLSFRIKL